MSNSSIEFRLMGGLGNQLFISTFATILSAQFGQELRVVLNSTELAAQSHGSGLGNLDLEQFFGELWQDLEYKNAPLSLSRVADRFRSYQTWEPRELGFIGDPRAAIPAGTRIVRGYFQSSHYVQQLRGFGAPMTIEPRDPSCAFSRAKEDIDWSKTALIHVRRGDYLALHESFGVLAPRYFASGVELLKLKGFSTFLVMSDSPDAAPMLASGVPETQFLCMSDFGLTSAEEELSLASKAGAFVMSNSSFSFWGAFGGTPKIIVAPIPWFKGLVAPSKLLHSFSGFEVHVIGSAWETLS